MDSNIFIPRGMINEIIRNAALPKDKRQENVQVCVKIPYKGLEISIACDSSHTSGDLFRSDIRVYEGEKDITSFFLPAGESMLYGDGDTLKKVFKRADTYIKNRR